jgi:predicted ribosomally synthesized peptide with nif11-like leader
MALTEDKARTISGFLAEDQERAKKLFGMEPEEAAKEFVAAGYDISAEDLAEFGAKMVKCGNSGELSDEDLEDVAGGLGVIATFAIAYGIAIGCGYVVGRLSKW